MHHTTVHPIIPDDNRKHYNASCQHDRQYQNLPILPYEAGSYSKGGQQNPSHHRSACLPIDGKDLPEYQYLRFFLPESTTYVRNLSGSQVIVFENKVKKGCFLRSGNLFQDQWQALFYLHISSSDGKIRKGNHPFYPTPSSMQ